MEKSALRLVGAVLFLCAALSSSANPGFKIRLTEKGIDYVNRAAQTLLTNQLRTLRIPDLSNRSGKTSFSATSVRMTGVRIPTSSMSLRPDKNGLTWTLSNFGMSVRANYRAIRRGWIRISNSGSISASISGVTVSQTVTFGRSGSSGLLTLSDAGCSSRIGSLSVRFHGRWAWLINLFKGWISRKIKDALRPQICQQVRRVVNEKAKSSLARMKTSADLTRYFYIAYGLVSSPKVTSNYLEIWNKGTVYSKSHKSEPPFSPQPIPPSGDSSRMVYFWVTQYSFNTLLYQAHTTGLLKYQVTKAMLPRNDQPALDMICGQNCIGSAFPQIASRYAGYSVDVGLESADMPRATLTTNKLTIDVNTNVDLRLRSTSNSLSNLASLNVSVSLTFVPSLRSDIVGGRITRHSLELSDIKLAGGQTLSTPTVLDTILTKLIGIIVVPKINVLAAQGVRLPSADAFSLRNAYISIKPGYMMIGTDMALHW